MSPHLINAIISIEDQDFYKHFGFSITGIIRSLWLNMSDRNSKSIRGGSTITQQLVKNRLLSNEKTYIRKIKELILAIRVESKYEKNQILEMYLNNIAFGGTNYGVEEAAWYYFDKSAKNLTLPESALLAGLPQAPSRYNPRGKTPELAYQRMNHVLKRMQEENFISVEELNETKNTRFNLNDKSFRIKAPHFVMYVKDLLLKKYTKKQINEGGLLIKTTLDLELHDKVQTSVTNGVQRFFRLWVSNGAALVTKPQTGEIL
ncbi:MAG: transglycosylase domain-containing protein, partial [bacterium]